MSLCLAAAGLVVQIATQTFTLSWTHTIEKTVWQEDWEVAGGTLVLRQARVKGSGAGMEPPQDAVLRNGFYVWRPNLPPQSEITLRRSKEAGEWMLCAGGRCAGLGDWLGGAGDPVRLGPSIGSGGCTAL